MKLAWNLPCGASLSHQINSVLLGRRSVFAGSCHLVGETTLSVRYIPPTWIGVDAVL